MQLSKLPSQNSQDPTPVIDAAKRVGTVSDISHSPGLSAAGARALLERILTIPESDMLRAELGE
ncbi:hypothetical protein KJ652_03910 [Patescibacteria group bacterium]|nr:hypothetical protein [Patescibacteria group bacterium]MBU1123710.1 hypothetical protein [Patescibacteria group bacterium]MBU1911861.1 hypothetical protein [Patescibacteria group bacterium]